MSQPATLPGIIGSCQICYQGVPVVFERSYQCLGPNGSTITRTLHRTTPHSSPWNPTCPGSIALRVRPEGTP